MPTGIFQNWNENKSRAENFVILFLVKLFLRQKPLKNCQWDVRWHCLNQEGPEQRNVKKVKVPDTTFVQLQALQSWTRVISGYVFGKVSGQNDTRHLGTSRLCTGPECQNSTSKMPSRKWRLVIFGVLTDEQGLGRGGHLGRHSATRMHFDLELRALLNTPDTVPSSNPSSITPGMERRPGPV